MSVKKINASQVFFNGSETHYAFRSHIDSTDYPQVHDFYEIILIIEGSLDLIVNSSSFLLKKGDMVLLRPNDIHIKQVHNSCQHSNLAFPADTIHALFRFLYDQPDKIQQLTKNSFIPICHLSPDETRNIQSHLLYLNRLPSDSVRRKNTCLRALLTEVISSFFMPVIEQRQQMDFPTEIPAWLYQSLDGLNDIHNLAAGMEYLTRKTGRTPEHICRAFRKHLNTTPMSYINNKRLNYAANLLRHSDHEIIDIAFDSGFQSVSHFYHLFHKQYQTSPLKYRNSHILPQTF